MRRTAAASALALVVACGGGAPPAPELHPTRGPLGSAAVEARRAHAAAAPDASGPAQPALVGEITVKEGVAAPRGRLVLGWRTAEEQAELEAGRFSLKTARAMFERWTAGEELDFAKTPHVAYRITGAPPDATPAIVVDVDHTFWPTVFGGGRGLTGSGKAGGGAVVIAPNPPKQETGEPCTGPRMKLVTLDAPELPQLAGRTGPRRFCAWLPKSWQEKSAKRLPIVLLLPGLMSNEMVYLRGSNHLGERFDKTSEETKREAILVGVDTSSALGSTYLEDSAAQGPWDTFLAKRALPLLEKELHAMPARTARALVGHSTGGLNAISYGLRHSELFSVIGASSPDAPDVEAWLFDPGTRHARDWIRKWTALEDTLGGAGQATSWAADWSPDPVAPHGAKWPFDLATGAADEAVVARWVAKTPHGLVKDAAVLARVKRDLGGRVFVTVGKADEFGLYEPAERFAKELDGLGVATRFEATDGGHGNNGPQLDAALRFVVERLDRAR